jgi:enoyl-CoA hydratase
MYKSFKVENEGSVMVVKFDRPMSLNALDSEMLREIDQVLDAIKKDDQVHVVVFTGEGKSFIAGADISEMSEFNYDQAVDFANLGQGVFSKLEELSKPTIAAINGFCLGGGNEFALACDIRIASEKAKFGQPEVTLGITPGFAGTQRLAKVVNQAVAKEMIFTGGMYDAQFALSTGLVSKVCSVDELMETVMKMANRIARNGQIAVRNSKKSINEGLELSVREGNLIEANYFGLTFKSEDQKQAMKAFLNKEKYNFKNI